MLVNPHANSCSQNILNFFYCGTIIPRCDYFHSVSVFTRFYPRSACFTRNGTVWVWSVFWLGGGGAGARLGGGGDAKLGPGWEVVVMISWEVVVLVPGWEVVALVPGWEVVALVPGWEVVVMLS